MAYKFNEIISEEQEAVLLLKGVILTHLDAPYNFSETALKEIKEIIAAIFDGIMFAENINITFYSCLYVKVQINFISNDKQCCIEIYNSHLPTLTICHNYYYEKETTLSRENLVDDINKLLEQ